MDERHPRQLDFLPETTTDFIFSILAEEFGLIGISIVIAIYLFIVARGLLIAINSQDLFSRLLASSISLTFFIYVFVNMGMTTGILPVVGVPLPLISKGGTSSVTLMIGLGILMSIRTHKSLGAKMSLKHFKILTLLLFISSSPLIEGSENSTQDLTIAKYEIMNELIRDHGFDEQYVNNIFDEVEFLPELIESISRPAEKTKSWREI
ncbi:MAG: hypothetical protein Ct9H300mP6_01130 [Gammaproteobacteria bacterium]|nr:MAG: hypothetical protein Ct9H300mP6_01130 [Gammaproteobacteria bacterium]